MNKLNRTTLLIPLEGELRWGRGGQEGGRGGKLRHVFKNHSGKFVPECGTGFAGRYLHRVIPGGIKTATLGYGHGAWLVSSLGKHVQDLYDCWIIFLVGFSQDFVEWISTTFATFLNSCSRTQAQFPKNFLVWSGREGILECTSVIGSPHSFEGSSNTFNLQGSKYAEYNQYLWRIPIVPPSIQGSTADDACVWEEFGMKIGRIMWSDSHFSHLFHMHIPPVPCH